VKEQAVIQIRKILCPIDFSDFSRRALDHAIAIATRYGSTIKLFHVSPVGPVAAYAPGSGVLSSAALTPDERAALVSSMREFAQDEGAARVPVECEAAEGSAASVILAEAETMPADLLVMGTHGRSGFERLLLGSVTEKVLRRAGCPVMTVPRGVPDAVPAPPVLFRRIIAAIDFSECSMHALDYATSIAQEAGASLTVIHVIELPADVPREVHETALAGPRNLGEFIALVEQDRRARLSDAISESVRKSCTVDTVLTTGKPYREVLRVAEEQNADLLVIGIHGRGPLDRLLFGSTAQHLVRMATCPVLTLRLA